LQKNVIINISTNLYKGGGSMGALILLVLKGIGIFLAICLALIFISVVVGSLEISFGAGSRKPKEHKQRKEED